MLAQTPAPCPADKPVDDISAEIHKLQSKKNSRNKNPLPDNICIFGWCRQAKTPPTIPRPAPRVEEPANTGSDGISSSKTPADKCNERMDQALEAAHNVEVGDFYFDDKNYRAALFRYQDADKDKAGDAAIHVRLGRAYEKLKQPEQAIEQYAAAEKLAGPEKWTEEARKALERLKQTAPANQ
jgi:tetratricopeptide (TPR) repeat protein